MPEKNDTIGFADPAKNNADVAAALLKQNEDTLDVDTGPASDALDKLAAEADKKKADAAAAPVADPVVEPKDAPAPAPDKGTPAAATPPAPTEEEKAAEAARVAAKARADELFKDSPALPTNASPKSSEAFNSIKIKAAQEISAREAEVEKLRKEKAELEEKLKSPVPPEIEKELEEHRNWRAKLDIDSDPKFKEFDKTISSTQEFIYAQLKKNPLITDAVIESIKKHGGPENVKLDAVFDAIKDPVTQRLVESKIADIEMAKYNKEMAIRAAKENVAQYRDARTKAMVEGATSHTRATSERLNNLLGAVDWSKEKPVDPKAEESVRKEATEYNTFLADTKNQLAAALKDDSAEMRAILLLGMGQLFHERRTNASKIGSLTAELETTKKSLADITAKWEKVKASSGRLQSSAPASGSPAVKPVHDVTTPTGDALDAIAKQVMDANAAKK